MTHLGIVTWNRRRRRRAVRRAPSGRHTIARASAALDATCRDGSEAILFACTGAFPDGHVGPGVVLTSRLPSVIAAALVPQGCIGLLVPPQAQVTQLPRKWARPGTEVHAEPPIPSAGAQEAELAARRLAAHLPDRVVMDCMSYTTLHRDAARRWRDHAARRQDGGAHRGGTHGVSATTMRDINAGDIEPIAVGAWILGTGDGGSPYPGLLNMRCPYAEGRRERLMSPDHLADDDAVAAVSNHGAPLVGQEKLTDNRNVVRAVESMEEFTVERFRAILSLEIGGDNAIQRMMAAAHRDQQGVDADGMGRARPEAQMTSFAVGGLKP